MTLKWINHILLFAVHCHHPGEASHQNREKVTKQILNKWTISVNIGKIIQFRRFKPWKMTFRAIQSNPALGSWLHHPWEGSCQNREKVRPVFWEKGVKCKKGTILTLWPVKMTIRAIQPNPSYPKEASNPNKATRSPEISREQVQKITPQFLLYIYWIWIPTVPIYNIKWEIIVLYSQIFFLEMLEIA